MNEKKIALYTTDKGLVNIYGKEITEISNKHENNRGEDMNRHFSKEVSEMSNRSWKYIHHYGYEKQKDNE